jgi:[lysine-biosynthesis-protein LysW]---L-2-aminoadipate ligase
MRVRTALQKQRLGILATHATETNLALARASLSLGVPATVMTPEQALQALRPGDVALGRLDVLPTLDGVEDGLWYLRLLERRGVRVLNPATALAAAHDKLLTARRLEAAAVPTPVTQHLALRPRRPLEELAPPLVLKPRFGSWGVDVTRCDDVPGLLSALTTLRTRPWFAQHGVLAQELVTPLGYDLRVLVAGSVVVGAVRRVAAPGKWRTNVALGAVRRKVVPPQAAAALALAAAAAVGGDLVGVDLLPVDDGWTVLEVNGAVDFTPEYADSDVFEAAVAALLDAARRASASEAASTTS